LDDDTAMREALMMGLRLQDGIDLGQWSQKFPVPLPHFVNQGKLARLIEENYIHIDEKALRATRAGRQRLNAVLGFLE
jgi:coproporphyrinogen III oxidase-like Fe-S oxidoreductase